MITAETLREIARSAGPKALALLRVLGYPVEPLEVDPESWRRAGVEIPWNGDAVLRLAARLRKLDIFVLAGNADEDSIIKFMHSYKSYNIIIKSVIIHESASGLALFDLSPRRELRRLDIDPAHPSVHALDRLNLLQLTPGAAEAIPRVIDRALDREAVTKRFFERFRRAAGEIAGALDPGEPLEVRRDQALLILSRLLFLSFVQEKGWLNSERRFLADRLERAAGRGENAFATVVKPLFFGCLNTPVPDRDRDARRLGRIPYLNGGLFEPSSFERRHPDLALPNDLMQSLIEELFEKFDFSVDEEDAAGLHVDPEMLGKVFESLMAEDERAASGSFYTPKEIVDAMTARAIAEWLEREGGGDAAAKLRRLRTIRVLDPACGSGAFLLSALTTIERLTTALSIDAGVAVERDLRRRIVRENLYGVDLKPEAVRLCELRLWLAIVSASDHEAGDVPPLPNLDRNIRQGHSLLTPTDFLGDGRGDIYREWRAAVRAQADLVERYRISTSHERPALSRLLRENDRRIATEMLARSIERDETELRIAATPQRDLFGNAHATRSAFDRCRELHERISATRRMLESVEEGVLEFFSFDVHFAPVMAEGGFDVVVGNPPWVRNGRIEKAAKRMYADRFASFRAGGRNGFHQPDLSLAFFERALSLTRDGGVVSMLMPAKVLNASYAARFRADLQSLAIVQIDDWSGSRKYFDADTFPLGLTVSKRAHAGGDVSVHRVEEAFTIAQRDLPAAGPGSEWIVAPKDVASILRRLGDTFAPLEETLGRRPIMGVKTGNNGMFFLDREEIRSLRIPIDAVCLCARGRDLRRWSAGASQWMLWPPRDGWRRPPKWLARLAETRGVDPAAFRLSFVRSEHVGIKVAWKDIARGMAAAVLPDVVDVEGRAVPMIPNQTLYSLDAVSLDEAYALAAVLNSTIFEALVLARAERAKDDHFRYFGRTIAATPLPPHDATPALLERLVRLSRRAHRGAAVGTEVDLAVAELYRVDENELARLREHVERMLGRDAG